MHKPLSLSAAACLLLAAGALAQGTVISLSPPARTTDTPKSIVLVPDTQNKKLYAICSMVQGSRQVKLHVTPPAVPSVLGSVFPPPAIRDQFCDAFYDPNFKMLFTAHRFGGLRVWKADPPALPLTQLSFTLTNYSHEGLKVYRNLVFYSEQYTCNPPASCSLGGLKIFRLNSNGTLSLIGQSLATFRQANALEVSRDLKYVWQWSDRDSVNNLTQGGIRVYKTNGFQGNPTSVAFACLPGSSGGCRPDKSHYTSKDLERNAKGNALLLAMGWDGMQAIDVTNPTAPVFHTVVPQTNSTDPLAIFVDGLTFIPNTDFAVVWGLVKINPNGPTIHWIGIVFAPTAATTTFLVPPISVPWRVDDVKVGLTPFPALYLVGRDPKKKNQPILVRMPN